jgi:Family of unknown function (DUF5998)
MTASPREALIAELDKTGYYPQLVFEALDDAIAGESVSAFFVHHEPTFDSEEVRRHLSVLVLTPSRFLLAHTDEHAADAVISSPYASTSVEQVSLSRISQVMVTRVVTNPAGYRPGAAVHEAVVSLGWGGVSRLELEPAGCADPECEADHGYTGSAGNEDFALRVSAAAEGPSSVAALLAFVRRLSAAARVAETVTRTAVPGGAGTDSAG